MSIFYFHKRNSKPINIGYKLDKVQVDTIVPIIKDTIIKVKRTYIKPKLVKDTIKDEVILFKTNEIDTNSIFTNDSI